MDSKGRSLVAGRVTAPGALSSSIFVARSLASGALDTAFGTDGTAVLDVGRVALTYGNHLTVDSKDRIVIIGRAAVSATSTDTFAARFAENGKLDTSFGAGGLVRGLVHDQQSDTHGLAVLSVGTSTLVYAAISRVLPDTTIVGFRLDESGTKLPYDFTIPLEGRRQDNVKAVAGAGGVFVGNRYRVYKLTATGAIDPSYGTAGSVEAPHDFLSTRRDGSLLTATGVGWKIYPPTGVGAPTTPPLPPDTNFPLSGIVERCDGTLVITAGNDATRVARTVRVVSADGNAIAGHPVVLFTPSPEHLGGMVPAIDPSTGAVSFFGAGGQESTWLGVIRARP